MLRHRKRHYRRPSQNYDSTMPSLSGQGRGVLSSRDRASKGHPHQPVPPLFRLARLPDHQQLFDTFRQIARKSPKWLGMVRSSWETKMRFNPAAIRRTSGSGTPISPDSAAVRKSTADCLRFRPRTIRSSKSASAWNLILMTGAHTCDQVGVPIA